MSYPDKETWLKERRSWAGESPEDEELYETYCRQQAAMEWERNNGARVEEASQKYLEQKELIKAQYEVARQIKESSDRTGQLIVFGVLFLACILYFK